MNVEERLKPIIADQLGIDEEEIAWESSFTDDLGADSLEIVDLIMAVEEEFDVEILDEEAEKITTFRDAVSWLESHASGEE